MNTSWITHNGKRILSVRFDRCRNVDEMMQTLDAYGEALRSEPAKVLVLVNFENVTPDLPFLTSIRERAKLVADKIHKNAVLGITGPKKVFFTTYSVMTRQKNLESFQTEAEALEWLVS